MKLLTYFSFWLACCAPAQPVAASEYDLVVYGGTAAGVIAAVQAQKMGKSVVLVCPDKHLGGLSSGGLGWTDTGNKAVIGGLAREFYHRVWKHYNTPDAWNWQKREAYGNKGQGTPAIDGERRTMWVFEPHVAEQVFEDLLTEASISVYRDEWLDRTAGVHKQGAHITSITMLSGRSFEAKMFIDATYEGDLLAAAGVDYAVGREAQSVYDEPDAGVQTGVLHHRHHFGVLPEKISPYVKPGDPASGVLPRISTVPPGKFGAGDKHVQAYCFRMCLTDLPENQIPFPKPAGYDPRQYELLLRIYNAGWRETFGKFDLIPNRKTDTNNHGPFSTDNIGFSDEYPEASYERRRGIIREHQTYQQGWLYFIANDPRVPREVRQEMRRWGLPKDEFRDNDGWSHQLYIREARRMVGRYVMTENELLKKRPTPDPVGMGSYTIDSHNVQRYITPDGYVQNEGDVGVSTKGPYEISYGSLVPKRGQVDNLLVPVCVSSSHIAFGSIRMEPVFMILGQSAATAACSAIDDNLSVQDVSYARLRERLLIDGQVLSYARPQKPAPPAKPVSAAPQPADDPALVPPPVNTQPGPEYADNTRPFQGIPGIERASDGRLWAVWYAGGQSEGPENYVVLVTSGDGGKTWSGPRLVIDPPGPVRAYDPCLWHDPQGRLWLFWAQSHKWWDGRSGVWAIVTDDSTAEQPHWSAPRRLSDGIMMNKPTVLSTGDGWLMPAAIWQRPAMTDPAFRHDLSSQSGANVMRSMDRGQTWTFWGQVRVPGRVFDEHSIIERRDKSLWMLVRASFGIAESTSRDEGKTWTAGRPSLIPHVNSRFFITRLFTGKLLLVTHDPPDKKTRSHLVARVSDDDGKTWQGELMIDERRGVSYPDGVQALDGTIYLIYDFERVGAKQILMATFRESDVLRRKWSPSGRQRVVVNQATGTRAK
jgi:predicted neuraminidase